MARRRSTVLIKTAIWIAALAPAAWLGARAYAGDLGANPIEEITHQTGWWALVLLMVTLTITPLRRLTGWHRIVRFRRLIGLFAFFYGTLHFLTYLVLDQFFAWGYIVEDIMERPFITVGFAAWLILLALACTSTTGWIRRLGKNWQRLHRLVYAAAALGSLHFLWKVKADTREPLVFLAILAVLLSLRLPGLRPDRLLRRWRRASRGASTVARRAREAPGPTADASPP